MVRRTRDRGRPRTRAQKLQTTAAVTAVVVVVVAFVVVEMTPWLGRGLRWALPTTTAQVVAGLVLALAVAVGIAWPVRRPVGAPYPAGLAVLSGGLAGVMFVLAPFGRGSSPGPGSAAVVPTLTVTLYASWLALGALTWFVHRHERRRQAAALASNEPPTAGTAPTPPRVVRRRIATGVAIPALFCATFMVIGDVVGPPPPPDPVPDPVYVQAPQLTGTDLGPRIGVIPLDAASAFPMALAVHDAIGVEATRVWETGLWDRRTSQAVLLSVAALPERTDLSRARRRLDPEHDSALPQGWVRADMGPGQPAMATLCGHDFLLLHASGRARLPWAVLARQLSAPRLRALVTAITAVG